MQIEAPDEDPEPQTTDKPRNRRNFLNNFRRS